MTGLQRRMAHAGISQTQMADLLGVSQPAVSYWYSGRHPIPTRRIVAVCRILHCNPRDLKG